MEGIEKEAKLKQKMMLLVVFSIKNRAAELEVQIKLHFGSGPHGQEQEDYIR